MCHNFLTFVKLVARFNWIIRTLSTDGDGSPIILLQDFSTSIRCSQNWTHLEFSPFIYIVASLDSLLSVLRPNFSV